MSVYVHFVMENLEYTPYNRLLVGETASAECSAVSCIKKNDFGNALITFSDFANRSGRLVSFEDNDMKPAVLGPGNRLFCCEECYLKETA